ncbi:MAG: hypothetical protein NPIRA04_19240 [Nitrospirales bacterium]|nr:MAG: hypothetical protein NPIRA04_19240 [Nitrospirales bacterium]
MQRQPTHPGELLKEDVLPAMQLSIAKAADLIGVTRQYLGDVANAKKPMSMSLCYKIGKLAGNGPDLWANMQTAYDLWQAKQDKTLQDNLKSIPTFDMISANR